MGLFNKEQTDKFLKIRCPVTLDAPAAKEFSDQAKAWLLTQVNSFIIDFSEVSLINREFYQALILLKTNLKRDQKILYSINLSSTLLNQIKMDGVEQAFNPKKSMDQVLGTEKTASAGARGLNVGFMNPFLTAALKTFEVQCNTKAKAQKPYLKKNPIPDIAIAGVLTLASDGFSGSIVLCFSKPVFLKVYENMFGEKHTQITRELEDAAAELLNIIYGIAKVQLNKNGFNFQKALPTILTGEKISVRQASTHPVVIIPIETDSGPLHMEIEFDRILEGNHV